MWPQLFAAAAVKLSFGRREVGSATNPALASANLPSPCTDVARAPNDFGRHAGVLEDYQKSLALRHRLVRIDPTNAQWRYDEACILDQIGYEYRKAGLSHDALAAYEVSAAIWRQLAKTDPRNRQLDLSISLGKLGDAKLAVADTRGAIAAYEESVVNWRRLLKRDPDNSSLRANLAECLEKIADLKFRAGDNTGALTAYEWLVAIWRDLDDIDEIDGNNAQRQWNLSRRLDRMGDAELVLGHFNAATWAYEESLNLRRRLAEATSNSRWQEGVSLSLKKIGKLKHVIEERAAELAFQREVQEIDHLSFEIDRLNAELQGKLFPRTNDVNETTSIPAGSLATIEERLTVSHQLATSDLGNAKYQCDFWADLEELAQVKIRQGNPVEALSVCEECLAVGRYRAHSDQNDEQLQRRLCVTLEKTGDFRQSENNHAAAIALYEESLCIRRRLIAQRYCNITGEPHSASWFINALGDSAQESDSQRRRWATARDQWDLMLTLRKVATVRLDAGDNSGARTALQESLQIARQLLEENKTSCVRETLHSTTRFLSKMSSLIGHQFEGYRNQTSVFFAVSAKARGTHNLPRAVKKIRLAIVLISRRYRNATSALREGISVRARDGAQRSRRAATRVGLATRQQSRRYRLGAATLADKILTRGQRLAGGVSSIKLLSAAPSGIDKTDR